MALVQYSVGPLLHPKFGHYRRSRGGAPQSWKFCHGGFRPACARIYTDWGEIWNYSQPQIGSSTQQFTLISVRVWYCVPQHL